MSRFALIHITCQPRFLPSSFVSQTTSSLLICQQKLQSQYSTRSSQTNMPAVKRKIESSDSSPISAKRAVHATTKGKNAKPLKKEEAEAETDNKNDFILRKYYPPEMTNERAQEYKTGKLPLPIDELEEALRSTKKTREGIKVKDAVVHWFRWDLRLKDNSALHLAYQTAKTANKPLVCLYVFSHQDFDAHYTSSARIDFALRTLDVLRHDLEKLGIPLWVEEVTNRKTLVDQVLSWCQKWGVSHLYGNMEYEVDELRRDTQLVSKGGEMGVAMHILHDTCIVAPGQLHSGSGSVYAVYSPYFKKWLAHVKEKKIIAKLSPPPEKNPADAKSKLAGLFKSKPYPQPAENKRLSMDDQKKLSKLWPAGEHEAQLRLEKFIERNVTGYADQRNFPAVPGTSALSVHFSAGTLSARQAVKAAADANGGKIDAGKTGNCGWISEIAWRDFYKGIMAAWPYVCMNKPFKPEYANIKWEYSDDNFQAWCEGRTGYPYIDASMRQLNGMKYMHNRARMGVASFLAKHLLLDWRKGERYFMETLIDGDFASNNGGWQWSASSGADPQPYFRIFNPLLQSEKFDPKGDYIREWVPELKNVKGKAIHDPYTRLDKKEFEKLGYPKPIIEHKVARERCLERYKVGLGKDTA